MPEIDLFILFRWSLALVVTVYATVLLIQWAWGWYCYLTGLDRYTGMLRRYIILHALRLRFTHFFGDALICILLCAAFGLIWRAQTLLDQMNHTIRAIPIQHARTR